MASDNPNRAPGKLTPSQARAARRVRSQRRRRLIRYASATAIGSVAIVFIIALFLPGTLIGGDGRGGGAPNGPGLRVESAQAGHIAPGELHSEYTSVPATSGQHYASPLAPVSWGIHDSALVPEEYVHNLEHGGIGIFYDCPDGCDALVAQLTEVVDKAIENNGKVLLAPHSGTGATITLAAWTFMDQFEAFDSERISDFVNSHESSANAPEPLAR
jgi:hypothetical protein